MRAALRIGHHGRMLRNATAAILASVACLGALTGCSDSDDEGTPVSDPGADAITATFDAGDRTDPAAVTVACAEHAGLCAQLAALAAPTPGRVCTQIYGGPATIALTGTHAGAAIDATIGRRDGCEIADYDRIVAAFDAARIVTPPGAVR